MLNLVNKLFGSSYSRRLKSYKTIVDTINKFEPQIKSLSDSEKIEFLRQMVRIRRFEEASLKYYNAGKMGGFLHLYIGQESIAVGTASLCGDNDHMITAYRDHAFPLAMGTSANQCMAELYGKTTGTSKGKSLISDVSATGCQ